jgi:hypothetical protein
MSILASLAEVGRIFATKAAAKSQEVNAPSNIANAFSVDPPKQTGAMYSVDIKIDLKEAPAAGAYEWGSGIHATKGAKGLYPIKAKNADELHFFWKERGKWFMGFELPFGHPGVAPRPYLVPTINDTKEEFKKILGQGFKAEILKDTKKIEVIEIK